MGRKAFRALALTVTWFGFGLLPAAGCGGGDDDGGTSCDKVSECPKYRCVCGDGNAGFSAAICQLGTCATGDQICDGACDDNGGLAKVEVVPSLKNTPECNALCQRIESQCPSSSSRCLGDHRCDIDPDECETGVRAWLQCAVDKLEVECTDQGPLVSYPTECSALRRCEATGTDGGTATADGG